MAKDPTNFRKRFKLYKEGKMPYENGLPRYGDGKDGITNIIPEDYQPIVSTTYQPIVDNLKQQSSAFNVDDYVYRALKLHPEVTRELVLNAYNSTPYIASDSRKGGTIGAYNHGEEDGYGRRVMLYPNGMKSDDPEFNLLDRMKSTLIHESNHLLRNTVLVGKYTDLELQYLNAAYPGVDPKEANANNMLLRDIMSGGAIGEKLDTELDNIRTNKAKLNELMYHYNHLNKYTHADKVNGLWDPNLIESIIQSLTNVASVLKQPRRGLLHAKNGKLPGYAGGKDPVGGVVDFLGLFEGYSGETYLDGKGIKTIGWGFTDPKFVNKGTITREEADAELRRQIKVRQSTLRNILGADKWDSLTDDSRKALTSYHYNYPAGFKSNTKFMKAWRAGNYMEAIRQVDAGMNDPKNPGLRTRRLAEQALLKADPFLTGRHEVPMLPIVAQPVSTAVRPTIPEQHTIPAYDTLVSPYISGKPMLHLMPTVNMPDLILMIEDSLWQPTYADGKLPGYADGKIHIKPSKRGTFTAAAKKHGASVREFESRVLKNPEKYSTAMVKKARFSRNARSWKH